LLLGLLSRGCRGARPGRLLVDEPLLLEVPSPLLALHLDDALVGEPGLDRSFLCIPPLDADESEQHHEDKTAGDDAKYTQNKADAADHIGTVAGLLEARRRWRR
tara:strand:+ start:839 stop:1150 length:312 start_codon:yes stop_codon:yes gene_type:complete